MLRDERREANPVGSSTGGVGRTFGGDGGGDALLEELEDVEPRGGDARDLPLASRREEEERDLMASCCCSFC